MTLIVTKIGSTRPVRIYACTECKTIPNKHECSMYKYDDEPAPTTECVPSTEDAPDGAAPVWCEVVVNA